MTKSNRSDMGVIAPGSPSVNAEGFVDRGEHLANLVSIRRSLSIGFPIWIVFGLADVAMDTFLHPGSLRYTLGIRFGTLPFHAAFLGRLYLQPVPSPRMLRFCELGMFTLAVVGISGMMIPLGGLNSIYFGGVLLCVGVRGAFKAERWQDGILPCALIVGAHTVAVVGGILVIPSMRQQLLDPGLLASFVVQLCFIVCAGAFGVIAANTFWTLRKQVF